MSNKSTKRLQIARLEREKAKKQNLIIGSVVGVVLLIIVAAFLYLNYGPKPATPTPAISTPGASSSELPPGYPPMTIDKTKQYFATVKMAKGGQFVIQLYPDKAPLAVNSFVYLARKGFFNGLTFHRVLEGFMAQGGDPEGSGAGGPGYGFATESNDLNFDKAGVVGMAHSSLPDSNGSQFFITFGPADFLDDDFTGFGQVIEGMDVVNAITRRDPEQSPTFTGDAMESVTITEK